MHLPVRASVALVALVFAASAAWAAPLPEIPCEIPGFNASSSFLPTGRFGMGLVDNKEARYERSWRAGIRFSYLDFDRYQHGNVPDLNLTRASMELALSTQRKRERNGEVGLRFPYLWIGASPAFLEDPPNSGAGDLELFWTISTAAKLQDGDSSSNDPLFLFELGATLPTGSEFFGLDGVHLRGGLKHVWLFGEPKNEETSVVRRELSLGAAASYNGADEGLSTLEIDVRQAWVRSRGALIELSLNSSYEIGGGPTDDTRDPAWRTQLGVGGMVRLGTSPQKKWRWLFEWGLQVRVDGDALVSRWTPTVGLHVFRD